MGNEFAPEGWYSRVQRAIRLSKAFDAIRTQRAGKGQRSPNILVQNVKLSEGTLEIDLSGAGKQEASFLGLAFGVADAKSFEAVYFRPFRFADDDAEAQSRCAVRRVA